MKRICIAGGGQVGYYLAKSLRSHGHIISIIDPDKDRCAFLAAELDMPVVCGDAIMAEAQKQAGCADCDAFVAVTGSDSDNLVACQVARMSFDVKKTAARCTNPQNKKLMLDMGVDLVVCGTENLATVMEQEIETNSVRQLLSLADGSVAITEINLPADFLYSGHPLSEIPVAADAILVSVTHGEELIIPRGSTTLQAGDKVLVLAKDTALRQLMADWNLLK